MFNLFRKKYVILEYSEICQLSAGSVKYPQIYPQKHLIGIINKIQAFAQFV